MDFCPQFAQVTSFAQLPIVWIRMLQEDFDEVMRGYPDSAHSMDLVAEHRLRVLHSSEAWKSLVTQQSLQTSGMRGKIQQALEVSTLLPTARLWLAAWGAGRHPGQGTLHSMLVLLQAWRKSLGTPLLRPGLLERCSTPAKKPVTCACITQWALLPCRSAPSGKGRLPALQTRAEQARRAAHQTLIPCRRRARRLHWLPRQTWREISSRSSSRR